MKLPYSWLRELTGVNWPVAEAEEKLTLSGTAVVAETVDPEHFRHVVVGRITRLEKHPQADRLLVTEVETGTLRHTVICGAPNCAVGQKVVLALPGANLRGEFPVKEITMRGVKSAGMICAEDELGLSDDHSGIIVLDEDAPLGAAVFDYLGLGDAILSFEITPNRPDCLSAIGVARELAILADRDFTYNFSSPPEIDKNAGDYIRVIIDDPDACPRYAARIIEDVTIGPSPLWLRKRLRDCGVRPINNIVDITNFVMMETGHPLHAFDYHRFGSREVVVRRAGRDEHFTTLDGRDHVLDDTVLLITNGKEGVAAAGVMGGLNSEIAPDTRTILLEAAYFTPAVIRRSARTLGLSSESSYRFERGVDPNGVIHAADRAASLMAELAGGKVLSGVVDNYARKITPVSITLRPKQVERILGVNINRSFVETILRRLGVEIADGEVINASAPTSRPDLTREIDLIEEIARLYGLDRIPSSIQNSGPLFTPTHRRDTVRNQIRDVLTGLGFDETLGSGLAHADRMKSIDPGNEPLVIPNRLSDEFAVLRTRLLYSLLTSAGNNVRHRNVDLKIFEIGRVYRRKEKSRPTDQDNLPVEQTHLGLLITGRPDGPYWKAKPATGDIFEVKGILVALADALGLPQTGMSPSPVAGYDVQQSFDVIIDDRVVGCAGLVDGKIGRLFDIKQDCFAAELDIEALIRSEQKNREFKPLPKYPASSRDIAIIVDNTVPAEVLEKAIRVSGGELVESVGIFDLFSGPPVPDGKKSLAFSVTFRSPEKTLEDEEIDVVYRAIVARLESAFGARLRE